MRKDVIFTIFCIILQIFITVPKTKLSLFGSSKDNGNNFILKTGKAILDAPFTLYNVATAPGNRFINFAGAFAEYYKYVQNIAMNVYQDMGLSGDFSFGDYANTATSIYGMAFYYSGDGTSISESANNSYTQSDIGAQANQAQTSIREEKTFAGIGSLADKMKNGIADAIQNVKDNIPVIGGIVGAFTEALDGDNMVYPNMWSDSTFDRSYDLQFEFYSPYGDPDSIFRYVYLPFICLMCMSLPLQDGYYSYKQPFMVRASSPGYFECESGVVTSFNFTRGDQSMWTVDGYPRVIKISMNIVDLYPSLIISKAPRRMKYNVGLTSFIEMMSGMRYDQFNFTKRLSTKLNQIHNRLTETFTFNSMRNAFGDFKYNAGSKAANFLR